MLVLPAGRIRFGSMHAVRAAGRGASPGSRVDAEDARAMQDRIGRERRRYQLAMRMVAHQARTQTICDFTGLTRERTKTLRREWNVSSDERRRGPSPTSLSVFFRSSRWRSEASSIAVFCRVLDAVPQSECLTPPDASRASIEASGSATSSKLIGHTFRNQRLASSRSSCSRPPSLRAKLCSSSAARAAVGQSWLTALQRATTSARSVTKSASRADAVTTWKTRA